MLRNKAQIVILVSVGVVVLLVGFNSIRQEDSGSAQAAREAVKAGSSGPTGEFSLAGNRKLIVDVSGSVRRPGVYRFEHGERVIDAIERAGGLAPGANVAMINRAATLSDGQQVIVPSGESNAAGAADTAATPAAPVSLGAATQEQLEEIDGIGPVTAGKIIEFREMNGGAAVDDLDEISGIGPATMESLRAALGP